MYIHKMDQPTLRLLAVNEMTMCENRNDKHWGAAWAYKDVAERMGFDADDIAKVIFEMAPEETAPTGSDYPPEYFIDNAPENHLFP